ncbi:MAG: PQQ-like beta-propeller repeat protein [Candidatus Aminicenantes bacterium]|nr:PQQ-like beta-propeller repeat protein [Candidatus Aminicenantes bacterium]
MLYKITKRITIVAAIFAIIISLLLIINFIQTKSIDPLNSRAISLLMQKLQESPGDTALKEEIRALDLLARKAYFTYQWQVRTGSILLFVFVLVFLSGLKYMSSLKSRLPDLSDAPAADETWENKLLSRRYIIFCGLGLFVLAFVLGILSESEMKNFGLEKTKTVTAGDFPTIEKIRENWPAFRGPEGNGISYHTGVPTEWDGKSGKNIAWKIPNPLPGFNSPILWADRLFLSGADKKTQVVYCFDAASGQALWQTALNDVPGTPAKKPKTSDDTGYAAPTMTTDGKRVFAIFATGDIACLDFAGKRVWAKNLGLPKNHYGHSSSLLLYRDVLLVQFDHSRGGRLIGLQANTGVQLYDTPRDVELSWASPIVVNSGSRAEVILTSNPFVMSYDPRTGKELWQVECMFGEVAPSPAYAGGMVYAVNENAILAAIKLGDKAALAWEYDDDLSEVASPVATEEFVIMASSYGSVTCLRGKSGEKYWVHEFDHGFYSSPILVGDNVYLMDMNGVMFIFKAAKEFEMVGKNELGEKAVTIPAFSNGRIYIRAEKHLFCIGSERGE